MEEVVLIDAKFKITKADFFKAARILGECKPERIPYLLEAFKSIGIDFPNCPEEWRKEEEMKKYFQSENHVLKNYDEILTEDEVALKLREAYSFGIKISAIGNACGMNRINLYQYMSGKRVLASPVLRERVLLAVDDIMGMITDSENNNGYRKTDNKADKP